MANDLIHNELIHEVEESLKQDRLQELWKKYSGYLIAGIITIVLVTALSTGWNSWNASINISNTNLLLEALEQENKPAAIADVMQNFRPGQTYRHLIWHVFCVVLFVPLWDELQVSILQDQM